MSAFEAGLTTYSRRRPDLERYLRRVATAYLQVWQEDGGDEYIATGTDLSLDRAVTWITGQKHWLPVDATEDGQIVFAIPRVSLVT